MLFNCDLAKFKNQIFATFSVCIISFVHGAGLGWLSPALIFLKTENSTLDTGPITVDEASWLGGIFPVGSVIGSFIFGYIGNAYGRKKALLFLVLPQIGLWLTIILAKHIGVLYLVRVFSGISGGGAFVTLPIFITEISSKEIRGSLGSCFVLAINIGTLAGYIVGAYFSYEVVPRFFIGVPIIYLISILILPETPQYLLMKGDENGSRNALKFYRNEKNMKNKSDFDEMFNELQLNIKNSGDSSKMSLHELGQLLISKEFIQCFILGLIYMLSGGFTIINYAASVLEETGANLDPNSSAILIGVSQIMGTYLSTIFGNRFTRKFLLSMSTLLGFVGLTTTGAFSLLLKYDKSLKEYSWIPITSLSFSVLVLSFGLMPLAFHVMAEILPQKVKSHGIAVCNILCNVVNLGILKIFPIMMVYLGLYSAMFLSGAMCLLGTLYILIFLPETRDKFV